MRVVMVSVWFVVMSCATSGFADDYVVTLTDRFPRRARVEATVMPDEGVLRLRDNEDSGLLHGWSTFIIGIEARTEEGQFLDLRYEPTGRWIVPQPATGWVHVRYWMNLQHDAFPTDAGDAAAAYATSQGVMWTGRTLFVTGRDTDAISVRFDLPEAWTVLTPWPAETSDARLFRVPTTSDLVNAALFAGTPRVSRITVGDVTARLALGGDHVDESERVLGGFVSDYLAAYRDLFDATPRAELPIIASEHATWSGGVFGHTISLTMASPPSDANRSIWGHVVAHELLHLWTGALMIPQIERPRLEWFIEGFSEYRSALQELRRGDIGQEAFLSALAAFYGGYLTSYGRVPMTSAADAASANPELVTSGGAVMALVLDVQIRDATGGTRGLDDLMRRLFQRHAEGHDGVRPLDLAALAEAIRQESGEDQTGFLGRYVQGVELLPIQRILAPAGLRINVEGSEEGPPIVELSLQAQPSPAQRTVWRALTGTR